MSFLLSYFNSSKTPQEPEIKQNIEEEWVVVPEQKVQEIPITIPDVTFKPTLVDIHNSLLSNRSEQEAELHEEIANQPVVERTVFALPDNSRNELPQAIARTPTMAQYVVRPVQVSTELSKPVVKKQKDRVAKLSNYSKPVKPQKMKMIRPLTNARGSKYTSKRNQPYNTAF